MSPPPKKTKKEESKEETEEKKPAKKAVKKADADSKVNEEALNESGNLEKKKVIKKKDTPSKAVEEAPAENTEPAPKKKIVKKKDAGSKNPEEAPAVASETPEETEKKKDPPSKVPEDGAPVEVPKKKTTKKKDVPSKAPEEPPSAPMEQPDDGSKKKVTKKKDTPSKAPEEAPIEAEDVPKKRTAKKKTTMAKTEEEVVPPPQVEVPEEGVKKKTTKKKDDPSKGAEEPVPEQAGEEASKKKGKRKDEPSKNEEALPKEEQTEEPPKKKAPSKKKDNPSKEPEPEPVQETQKEEPGKEEEANTNEVKEEITENQEEEPKEKLQEEKSAENNEEAPIQQVVTANEERKPEKTEVINEDQNKGEEATIDEEGGTEAGVGGILLESLVEEIRDNEKVQDNQESEKEEKKETKEEDIFPAQEKESLAVNAGKKVEETVEAETKEKEEARREPKEAQSTLNEFVVEEKEEKTKDGGSEMSFQNVTSREYLNVVQKSIANLIDMKFAIDISVRIRPDLNVTQQQEKLAKEMLLRIKEVVTDRKFDLATQSAEETTAKEEKELDDISGIQASSEESFIKADHLGILELLNTTLQRSSRKEKRTATEVEPKRENENKEKVVLTNRDTGKQEMHKSDFSVPQVQATVDLHLGSQHHSLDGPIGSSGLYIHPPFSAQSSLPEPKAFSSFEYPTYQDLQTNQVPRIEPVQAKPFSIGTSQFASGLGKFFLNSYTDSQGASIKKEEENRPRVIEPPKQEFGIPSGHGSFGGSFGPSTAVQDGANGQQAFSSYYGAPEPQGQSYQGLTAPKVETTFSLDSWKVPRAEGGFSAGLSFGPETTKFEEPKPAFVGNLNFDELLKKYSS